MLEGRAPRPISANSVRASGCPAHGFWYSPTGPAAAASDGAERVQ